MMKISNFRFAKMPLYIHKVFWVLWNVIWDYIIIGKNTHGQFYNEEVAKKGGFFCESTDYRILNRLVKCKLFNDNDIVVDFGCGYERFLHYLIYKGFNGQLYGIELWDKMADFCIKTLSKSNVKIIKGSFLEVDLPKNFSVIYYANPADENVTMKVIEKLESYRIPFLFIYVHPRFAKNMIKREGWEVYKYFQIKFRLNKPINTVIFRYTPHENNTNNEPRRVR